MSNPFRFLGTQKKLWEQRREIVRLQRELETLRVQNQSMQAGMRRCLTCEYRIDFKRRQGQQKSS